LTTHLLASLRLLFVTVCLSGTVASTQVTSTGYTTSTVVVDALPNWLPIQIVLQDSLSTVISMVQGACVVFERPETHPTCQGHAARDQSRQGKDVARH